MGFRDIFYSEDEKRRLDLRAKIKEREQAAKPSGRRPRVSPNFSGASAAAASSINSASTNQGNRKSARKTHSKGP